MQKDGGGKRNSSLIIVASNPCWHRRLAEFTWSSTNSSTASISFSGTSVTFSVSDLQLMFFKGIRINVYGTIAPPALTLRRSHPTASMAGFKALTFNISRTSSSLICSPLIFTLW